MQQKKHLNSKSVAFTQNRIIVGRHKIVRKTATTTRLMEEIHREIRRRKKGKEMQL